MATVPTKTVQTALIAWQDIASAAQVISSAFNGASIWAAAVAIRIARRTGTAFTAGWPNIRLEASFATSGNNTWIPLYTYQPLVGASIVNTTLNGAITANASTFVVTATTNMAIGDLLFLGDPSTANYEIVRIKSISGTTITPEENVVNAHATAALVTDQAEVVFPLLDLSTYVRLRCVADNAGSGQAISVEVQLITFDSFA
jgi:hypothetical protein